MHCSPKPSFQQQNDIHTLRRTPKALIPTCFSLPAILYTAILYTAILYTVMILPTAWMAITPSQAQETPEKNTSITLVSPRVTTAIHDHSRHQWIIANPSEIQILDSDKLQVTSNQDNTRPLQRIAHQYPHITKLALSPDSSQLLVAGGIPAEQGGISLYDWNSKQLVSEHSIDANGAPITDVVTDVQWSKDGTKWIEAHWSGKVLIRDHQGKCLREFNGHTGPVLTAIFWSSDVAISSGIDQSIKVWNTNENTPKDSDQVLRSLNNHTAPVTRLIQYQNEEGQYRLISCSQDQTIRLWDPSIGRMIRFLRLDAPPTAATITKNNSLLTATEDGIATLWGLPNFERIQSWKLEGRIPRAIDMDKAQQVCVGWCALPPAK